MFEEDLIIMKGVIEQKSIFPYTSTGPFCCHSKQRRESIIMKSVIICCLAPALLNQSCGYVLFEWEHTFWESTDKTKCLRTRHFQTKCFILVV